MIEQQRRLALNEEQYKFGLEALSRIRKCLPINQPFSHYTVRSQPFCGHSFIIIVDFHNLSLKKFHTQLDEPLKHFVLEIDICLLRGTMIALLGKERLTMPPEQIDSFLYRVCHYLRHWKPPVEHVAA
ncbi:MAG TPA: hypothetical protein VGE31_01815 [Candidatus Paceibacterota bacterium]